MLYASHERSAWTNGILLDMPVTPLPSARAAAETAEFGGFDRAGEQDAVDEELTRLRALLAGTPVAVGPRSADSMSTMIAGWVESIGSDPDSLTGVGTIMAALSRNEKLIPALAGLDSVGDLTSTIRRWQQHAGLDRLERAVKDPTSTRGQLREILAHEWWVFGGNLLPLDAQRLVTELDIQCVPLLRYDRAIHAIVAERANVDDLVFQGEDGGYQVSPSVHAALDRARRLVDELEQLRGKIGALSIDVECSRALVTVVVGHPYHLGRGAAPVAQVREQIRRLNTYLAGVNVVTYEELVSAARQLLNKSVPRLAPVDAG